MPFIEQLIYGVDDRPETPVKAVLGQSAGVTDETAAEVVRLCRGWGETPPMGLQRPALLVYPLNGSLPALRGKLYAVIRASAGDATFFHAVIVNDQTYATVRRNPFALAGCVKFHDSWAPGGALPRVEIETEDAVDFLPVPNAGDVGLVDEIVERIIASDKLELPLEQATAESDRALALAIAALPEKVRKELRFASFATSGANAHDLGGRGTEGGAFAGWRRVLLAEGSADAPADVAAYREAIVGYLTAGDLNGLHRTSQRQQLGKAPSTETVTSAWQEPPPPEPERSRPAPAPKKPAAPMARPAPKAAAPAARPAPKPAAARIGGHTAAAGPPAERTPPRQPARSRSAAGWRRVGPGQQGRPGGRGFVRFVTVLGLLFLVGWVGSMWREGAILKASLEWAGWPEASTDRPRGDRASSLQQPVDVAGIYAKQRRRLAGGTDLGLGPSRDKARGKALAALRRQAAGPLLSQVDLFVELAHEGVQGKASPASEIERLEFLTARGNELAGNVARLELAWHSLASGVLWADLGSLSAAAAMARRDSLSAAETGALDDARRGLEITAGAADLEGARRHTEGMAGLMRLYGAATWSDLWERRLQRAAEMVSPAASPATRAHRNCAFALLRLKEAERGEAAAAQPFVEDLDEAEWPAPEVADQLRQLRREAGRFSAAQVPTVVAATLEFYGAIAEPAALVAAARQDPARLDGLAGNAAMAFDPGVYGPYLARLRYESAPDSSVTGGEARFRSLSVDDGDGIVWRLLAGELEDPFLIAWSERRASRAEARDLARQTDFTAAWVDCRTDVAALRRAAASGRDWSAAWRRVDAGARDLQERLTHGGVDIPAEREVRIALGRLSAGLGTELPLGLGSVTIRLDQEVLSEPTEVRLTLATAPGGRVLVSPPFTLGPSAPAGTGWVGTVAFAEELALGARQSLTATLSGPDGTLLEVSSASLAAGGGPGLWTQPLRTESGSVTLRTGGGYWSALELPEVENLF